MKILSTLFVRKNLPILAVLLGLLSFFSIRFESVLGLFGIRSEPVKPVSSTVKPVSSDQMDQPSAKPFFCSLEDVGAIEGEGGDVDIHGSEKFPEGGCSSGFVSKEKEDRVTFPVDGKFTYLEAGTIELCLTPQTKFFEQEKELFLFATRLSENAIQLKVVYPKPKSTRKYPSLLRLRMKRNDGSKKNSRVETSKLEWKVGQHYHIAGTWGENELRLYRDGKVVKTKNRKQGYRGPPEELKGRFVVNNTSPDEDECEHPTHCIISNLVIHNAQLDPEDLGKKCPIRERWFPEK